MFLTMLCMVFFTVFGSFLRSIVGNMNNMFITKEGCSIDVQIDSFSKLSDWDGLLDSIMELEHIEGYDSMSMGRLCTPLNFSNVDYEGNVLAYGESSKVYVEGGCYTEYIDSFRNGEMKLVDGVLPSLEHPGVAVDKNIAEKNGLHIGDVISVASEEAEVDMELVGIYDTYMVPKVEAEINGFYKESANSYLFCDYGSYVKLTGYERLNLLRFYVDEYANLDASLRQIKELTADKEALVINCIKNLMQNTGSLVPFLEKCSKMVLGFNYISCAVIMGLMIMLWMRSHAKMIMIYKILGQNELGIIAKIICEILVIEFISGGAGFFAAAYVLKQRGSGLVEKLIITSGNRIVLMNFNSNFGGIEALGAFDGAAAAGYVVALVVTALATAALAGVYMSRMKVWELRRMQG